MIVRKLQDVFRNTFSVRNLVRGQQSVLVLNIFFHNYGSSSYLTLWLHV